MKLKVLESIFRFEVDIISICIWKLDSPDLSQGEDC